MERWIGDCESWGYGIRVTIPEDIRPFKKITHGTLVKIYGWEFMQCNLRRAAQSGGASKCTLDIVNPLVGMTPLLLQVVYRHLLHLEYFFWWVLLHGPWTGTGEPVFLRDYIYIVYRTRQISFPLYLMTSKASRGFLTLSIQNAHKTPHNHGVGIWTMARSMCYILRHHRSPVPCEWRFGNL
jgi:hypothetical protein